MRLPSIAICLITTASAVAQVSNGSFETALSGWLCPMCPGTQQGVSTNTPGGTGGWSYYVVAEQQSFCPVTYDLYQPLPWLTPGSWTLSYWSKGHGSAFGPPARVMVAYHFQGSAPALTSGWDGGNTTCNWIYQEETFYWDGSNPPVDSLMVFIAGGAADDGPLNTYFDDIRVQQFPAGINFTMRAALDGALPSGTLMTDGLRAAALVPAVEPYSNLGYTYTGTAPGAAVSSSALLTITGNNAIVDWVVVELRSTSPPYPVVHSKPALLQRDGDLISPNGSSYLNCPVAAGSYRVALRHRNLGIMRAAAATLANTPDMIDMRSTSTTCYGTNARVLKGTVQCLWAGDATGNGQLRYTGSGNDRDPILIALGSTTPNNTVPNVYNRRDLNLDGAIKYTGSANDRDIILTNVGSTTPNNTRTQQLP